MVLIVVATVMYATSATVSADTLSVTQIITIKATVAPMRSIVVNDKGQMTMIYSNTDQNVTPKVYLNEAPGPERLLTPALKAQYDKILRHTKDKVGVAIPVSTPVPTQVGGKLRQLLSNDISSLLRPNH